jgi:phage terminase large subunit-like protein
MTRWMTPMTTSARQHFGDPRMAWLSEVDRRFLDALGTVPLPERTLGPQVCRWIEKNCVMGEGDQFGQPVRMQPFQRALFWKLYEIRDNGARRYRKALISLGKGSGKTPVGGWIGDVDLAGPSVFGGWKADGTPKGTRRNSPDVVIMASSYEQADMILDEIRATFDEGPLAAHATTMKGLVELTGSRGKARRIPATVRKADGSKATTLLVDEAHELVTDRMTNAYDVAAGGTAKRADSLTALLSTAGNDLLTMFGKEFSRGQRGDFADDELFVYLCADDGLDPTDDADIAKGIRQANPLVASGIANVAWLVAEFKRMPVYRARRYFWNQWVPTDESWLPYGAWDACGGKVTLDPNLPTWVGVDMSLRRDSSAVVTVQQRPDNKVQVSARIWFPDGRLIDQTEVDDYLTTLAATCDVRWIAADPAFWPSLPELEEAGLPIVRWPQQGRNMIVACARTYRLILDGVLVHDGAPDFSDQVSSAAPHSTDRGWALKKGRTSKRIDSAVALAMAIGAMGEPVEEPEKPLPRSVIV